MTAVDVPTMPLNCRTAPTPVENESATGPGAGTALGSGLEDVRGTTRREVGVWSVAGLARVRFASPGGLTSIGGN
jgi:hypothetical protein